MKTVRTSKTPRLHYRPAPAPTRLQQEAMWKSLRIREALKAAGYQRLVPLLSKDRKSVEIHDLWAGPQIGVWMWAGEPWPSRESPAPRYEGAIIATAPLGKADAELPAWEAAYRKLMPEEAS